MAQRKVTKRERKRKAKIHENKSKVQALLGFDTEKAFDDWRQSPLVKPWWETYVSRSLDFFENKGKKLLEVQNLINRIHEGEWLGKRRYLSARDDPQYDNPEDYHAWLVFWLASENVTDRQGCFWRKQLDMYTLYSTVHTYVLWARRQRHRDAIAATKRKSKKAKMEPPQDSVPGAGYHASEEEEEDMDPDKGTAIVLWMDGIPDDLVEGTGDKIIIQQLCSHSLLSFWKAVDIAFDLAGHGQRRTFLGAKGGLTFREAQSAANAATTGKRVIFHLHTESATILDEAQAVLETSLTTPGGDAVRES